MFATNPPTAYFSGYPQSQAPTTSGMNASQSQTPDHSQLGMPSAPSAMVNGFPQEYGIAKTKRKQVRNACINCQKACKKCDEQRPCPRCVKYGSTDTCVNSVRKERKKGVKRGPYKKRKQGGATSEGSSSSSTPNMSVPQLPNGMYSAPPTSAAAIAAASRGPNAPIAYQPYGNTTQFESFPNFQGNAQYLPYNILSNMNNIIQQAAANANAANGPPSASKDSSQQQQQQQQQQQEGATETKPSTDTDENGKLSILSQLCTAVLDRAPGASDANKDGEPTDDKKDNVETKEGDVKNDETTLAQSTSHSRESTKDGSVAESAAAPTENGAKPTGDNASDAADK